MEKHARHSVDLGLSLEEVDDLKIGIVNPDMSKRVECEIEYKRSLRFVHLWRAHLEEIGLWP